MILCAFLDVDHPSHSALTRPAADLSRGERRDGATGALPAAGVTVGHTISIPSAVARPRITDS